jgi:hypothetical protein
MGCSPKAGFKGLGLSIPSLQRSILLGCMRRAKLYLVLGILGSKSRLFIVNFT